MCFSALYIKTLLSLLPMEIIATLQVHVGDHAEYLQKVVVDVSLQSSHTTVQMNMTSWVYTYQSFQLG